MQIGIVLPGIKAETTAAPGSAYNSSKTAAAAAAAAAVAALSPRSSGRKKAQTASTSSSGRKGRGKQKAKREEFDSDGDDDGDYPGAEDYDEPYDDEQDTSPSKDEQGVCTAVILDVFDIVTVRCSSDHMCYCTRTALKQVHIPPGEANAYHLIYRLPGCITSMLQSLNCIASIHVQSLYISNVLHSATLMRELVLSFSTHTQRCTRRSKRKASSPAAAVSDEYDGDAPKRKSARSVKTNTFYTEDSVV
eukprot:10176-Heterococcus_DN1.PRE.2